jgi:hypothetical protein
MRRATLVPRPAVSLALLGRVFVLRRHRHPADPGWTTTGDPPAPRVRPAGRAGRPSNSLASRRDERPSLASLAAAAAGQPTCNPKRPSFATAAVQGTQLSVQQPLGDGRSGGRPSGFPKKGTEAHGGDHQEVRSSEEVRRPPRAIRRRHLGGADGVGAGAPFASTSALLEFRDTRPSSGPDFTHRSRGPCRTCSHLHRGESTPFRLRGQRPFSPRPARAATPRGIPFCPRRQIRMLSRKNLGQSVCPLITSIACLPSTVAS